MIRSIGNKHHKGHVFEWYGQKLPDGPVSFTHAHGFCFSKDGQLLVVKSIERHDHWTLPGGTIEPGEAPEETLVREVMEEAQAAVKKVKLMGYQKVTTEDNEVLWQVRYVARVASISEGVDDPGGDIVAKKFIDLNEFLELVGWDTATGVAQVAAARKLKP